MGTDKYKPRRRGLLRCVLIPCCSVMLIVFGFVFINFNYLSVDLNTAKNVNTHYQESIPQIPVVPLSQHAILPNSPLLNQQQAIGIKDNIVPVSPKKAAVAKQQNVLSNDIKNSVKEEIINNVKKNEEIVSQTKQDIASILEEEQVKEIVEEKKAEEVEKIEERVEEVEEEKVEEIVEEKKADNVEEREEEKEVEEEETVEEVKETKMDTKEEKVEKREPIQAEKQPEEKVESHAETGTQKPHLRNETEKHSEASEPEVNTSEITCANTPLSEALKHSSLFKLSDFDCSVSNEGWRDHLPPPPTNSSMAHREWSKRMAVIEEFATKQDQYDFDDEKGKYIVFWPIFAGIGNNLAVFSEVLLIAARTNRKFLVYDWDALREYFYLPFQYEVITEKVWERDKANTLIVEKSNECPFNVVDLVHGKVDARFVVFRSTCLTAQQLIKNKADKRWFTDRGITTKILVGPQELLHHIYRWLYVEVMTPRPFIQEAIEQYKKQFDWEKKYMVGIHIRTGGVAKETIQWGRFLNERDVQMFKKYALQIKQNYENGVLTGYVEKPLMEGETHGRSVEKFNQKAPVGFYVLSDQDSVKSKVMDGLGEGAVTTRCDMTHTNVARKSKENPGFICALIENYLLSSSDILVLTTRSTYGYLARHRTNAPFVTVDLNCFDGWKKLPRKEKTKVPVEFWSVNYM